MTGRLRPEQVSDFAGIRTLTDFSCGKEGLHEVPDILTQRELVQPVSVGHLGRSHRPAARLIAPASTTVATTPTGAALKAAPDETRGENQTEIRVLRGMESVYYTRLSRVTNYGQSHRHRRDCGQVHRRRDYGVLGRSHRSARSSRSRGADRCEHDR